MAGHVGLELRNVDANYPFERSHRFAGIQPNSGLGDYSRLSCGVASRRRGARAAEVGCQNFLRFDTGGGDGGAVVGVAGGHSRFGRGRGKGTARRSTTALCIGRVVS